jgi:type III restriction enzyme
MRALIRTAIVGRKKETRYELVPVALPIEPVLVPSDARNAYNDDFVKYQPFVGWNKSIMPVATFDAGSTEWALAHLLDRDDEITWWLRLYVGEQAYIPTTDGKYFPDFIAIDRDGTFWLIEGKSDKNANDADVLRKKAAAENWARSVRDDGGFGTWRFLFATESHIKQAAGSWSALVVATSPE